MVAIKNWFLEKNNLRGLRGLELTIKKETNSWFYTFLAMIIPTIIGISLCLFIHLFEILLFL